MLHTFWPWAWKKSLETSSFQFRIYRLIYLHFVPWGLYLQSVSQLMHAQKCRLSWRWNKRQAWMGCIGRKEGIRITLRLKKEGFIERICRLFSLHFESYRHIPQNSRNSGKKRCGTLNNIAQFHHSNEENPWIKQTGSCSTVLGPF